MLDRVRAEAYRRLCAALRCEPREIEARVQALQGAPRETATHLLQRLEDLESGVGPRCTSADTIWP